MEALLLKYMTIAIKLNKVTISLFIILCVASFLRLWHLSSVPPHLTSDEAALGYNAYSIMKTGRDEYGKLLPLIFKSFGDYKPGLYVYTAIPFIKLFGLNEFSVRLPSALSGIATVAILYLLVRDLTQNKKIAIAASSLLAISPWHIQFSRGAWEITLNLLFVVLGVYFFLRSFKSEKKLLYSLLFFGLSFLTYQGAKISTPIIMLILFLVFNEEIRNYSIKNILKSALVFGVIMVPVILSVIRGQTGRASVFSVFSYPRPAEYLQAQLKEGNEVKNSLTYYVLHSEALNFTRGILGRWFNHFSGRFLFFEGDWSNPRHSAPYTGELILLDAVFLVGGIFALFSSSKNKPRNFIIIWLLLAPLGAAITRDQVHAVRSFNMVIPLTILLAHGVNVIYTTRYKIFLFLFTCFYILNYLFFLDAYFVHLPAHSSKLWNYGYREVVKSISTLEPKYDKIVIPQSYAQPYIYFLFYQKYDPQKYQKIARLDEDKNGDVGLVEKIDNVYFKYLDWPQDKREKNIILVADDIQAPISDIEKCSNCKVLQEIKYLDHKEIAFRIIEIK